MEFEYVGPDTRIQRYIPIPKQLVACLSELKITNMTTVLLYGMLLDRAMLSQKNRWTDDGKVYIRYPVKAMAKDLNRSESSIKKCLSELESKGLIRRERDGFNVCSRIFLRIPVTYYPSVSQDITPHRGKKSPPNNYTYRQNRATRYTCREGESL